MLRRIGRFVGFGEFVAQCQHVDFAVMNGYIEVGKGFVAHFFRQAGYFAIGYFYFPVFQSPPQDFASVFGIFVFYVLDTLANFGACARGNHIVNPIVFGRLIWRCQHRDLVAVLEHIFERDVFVVDHSAHAMCADGGVNREGEIEHCGAFGQVVQVAFGCKHEHIVVVELHFELVDDFAIGGIGRTFENFAQVFQPFVHFRRVAFDAFVFPMRCHAFFGHFVHPFGAYLHLDPFALRSHHGNVQTFVAIGFGCRNPIAQAVDVVRIHIGNHRKCLPASGFFLFFGTIDNHADSKQIVHFFERHLLFAHFVPDGMYGFGAPFDGKRKSLCFKRFFDRLDKLCDVGIARTFGFVQFVGYLLVDVVRCIFERQILQLGFDGIQAHAMRQRCIETRYFAGNFLLCIGFVLVQRAHSGQAFHNHNHDDSHIFGKGNQQLTKIFGIDRHVSFVQAVRFLQATHDGCCRCAIVGFYFFHGDGTLDQQSVQYDGTDAVMSERNLAMRQYGSSNRLLQAFVRQHARPHSLYYGIAQSMPIGRSISLAQFANGLAITSH